MHHATDFGISPPEVFKVAAFISKVTKVLHKVDYL